MSLVSDIISSLVGGVSQAPAAARLPGKGEIITNALLSVVEGHDKRPPTEHVATLVTYDTDPEYVTPMVHCVERDAATRYAVVVEDGICRVFDLTDGGEYVVNVDGNADDYLVTDNARSDLDAMTIGDTTFIWNRSVTVENVATASAAPVFDALIFVRAGSYGRKYTVTVNGTEYFYMTPDGSSSWNTPAIDAAFIAEALVEGSSASNVVTMPVDWHTSGDYSKVSATSLDDLGGTFTVSRRGSVIRIQSTVDFDLSIDDSQGGAAMTLIKGNARRISDLPQKAWDGFKCRVGKVTEDTESDLWLEFDDPNDDGEGEWVETVGESVNDGIDPETMPVQLMLQDDGTFTLQYGDWTQRTVGTSDSSPDPTFVGHSIQDMFYYLGRTVIVAGEDWSFGAAQDLLRFYRETVKDTLPDDPFTLTATTAEPAFINWSVVQGRTAIAFSNKVQMQLQRNSELFTRGGTGLIETTAFSASPTCRPVSMGNRLAFAYSSTSHSRFAEYTVLDSENGAVDDGMSADILRYVPADVFKMACTPSNMLMVAVAESSPASLWPYSWFNLDRERLQSAWNEWTFDAEFSVLGAAFIGPRLHLLMHRAGYGLYLEVLDVSPGLLDTDLTYRVRLDGRCDHNTCMAAYDETEDATFITLPYDATDLDLQVVAIPYDDSPIGVIYEITDQDGPEIWVDGDISEFSFYIGRPYEWQYRFSTLYVRDDGPNQSGAPVLDGRLMIADMTVDVIPPAYIKARVTNERRDPYEKVFSDYVAEHLDESTDENRKSVPFKFRVAGQNSKVTIDLLNDTFLPNKLLGCQWRGNFTPPVARQA